MPSSRQICCINKFIFEQIKLPIVLYHARFSQDFDLKKTDLTLLFIDLNESSVAHH